MTHWRASLTEQLRQLGVPRGGLVMPHGSLRAIGPVVGGVNTVVQSLLDAVGPEGTVAVYVDFEPFFTEDDNPEQIPVFDKRTAHAARDHGVLHETLRNWPGALRSDHPDAGVAAVGAEAEAIVRDHPFQFGYGPGTPFERIVDGGGQVLMLGAPLDTITLLHYAEHVARIPDKRVHRYRRKMPFPEGPRWVAFEEFDTSDPVHDALPLNCFEQIAQAYLAAGGGSSGRYGDAPAYLFPGKELVRFAVEWLEGFPYPRPA